MYEQRIFEVIYIQTSITTLWEALTNPDITQRYRFDIRIESDWKMGSKVQYLRNGESTDEHIILAIEKHHILSHASNHFLESSNPQKSQGIHDTDYFKLKIRQTSVPDDRNMFYADA